MKKQDDQISDATILRQRAEKRLKKLKLDTNTQGGVSHQSDAETMKLLHELQVHQIELEMQNAELTKSKEEVELAKEKYTELYDFAPSGYITLTKESKISELNYTAARMLGKVRMHLKDSSFGFFVSEKTRQVFNLFFMNVFKSKIKEICELILIIEDGSQSYVHVEGIISQNGQQCFTSLVDITQQKQAELLQKKNEELIVAREKAEISEQITREYLYKLNETKEKVEENVARITALLSAIPDMMFILNRDGVFIEYHTDHLEKLFTSPEMFIGKNISQIFSPDIAQEFKSVLEKAIKTKQLQLCEYELPLQNGNANFECRLIALENDKILSIIRDITERKKTEQALNDSNELLSLFVKHSPIYAFIKDVTPNEGRVIMASDNYKDMIGIAGSEMVGKSMHELFPADLADKFTVDDWKVISDGQIFKVDEELNGRSYTSIKFPISIGGKNLLAGYSIDITERKQAEIALKESENKFRTIADYTYDWEFWLSPENTLIYVSPSCQKITGYSTKEFKDNPNLMKEIIHIDDLYLYRKHEVFVYKYKTSSEIDFRIINRNGHIRWINHICQPVLDENGNFIGIRGSNRDITRRKANEKEIMELNEKLKILNTDKDRFISILAHDLKNPFNTILGLLELLSKNIDKYEIHKIEDFINRIKKSALNTFNLLDDLLMWVRSQSGKLTFEPQELNFTDVCNGVIDILKINAINKKISINHALPNEISVFTDINMLKTILRNLVSNAIKFTNKGGKIEIFAEQELSFTTITVSDNGTGIKPETLAKLFDSSQKNTTAGTENESGTGLGLLLCKEFIEKSGGKIWVESEVGKGSKFKFTLHGTKSETF